MKSIALITTAMAIMVGIAPIHEWGKPVNAQVTEVKGGQVASGLPETQTMSKISEKNMSSSKSLPLPVYKPPKGIGAPGGRVGGGTRGNDTVTAMLFALVPDHLGLTIKEQPSLYWYLSNNAAYKMVLTINHEDLVKPVLELTLPDDATPGIHSISLKKHNLKLELDSEYRWFVELVVDDDYPARNIVAGGRIKRITPPETLLVKLRDAEPQEVTSVYSEAGLWYDAFDSISDLIKANSGNGRYKEGRDFLLKQVELEEIAEAEERVSLLGDSTSLYYFDYLEAPYGRALVDFQLKK